MTFKPLIPDKEFIELFPRLGPVGIAKKLGSTERGVLLRRQRLEKRYNIVLKGPDNRYRSNMEEHPARIHHDLTDGVILVGSDSHYWPGIISAAHRAFVKLNRELKPAIVIKNGDELDFPGISRHAPIGWESRPSVISELEYAQERLAEVEDGNKNAAYYWPLGNHDARYETRLATVAPEYARVRGVHLKDHFPRWKPCWSVWVNDVVIKHRFKGGTHATRTNTLNAGRSMVTGHLHSLKVAPLSDYNGTRWGVDCGTMAIPYSAPFVDYTEDSPVDWRSGFAVLTIHRGKLLWPELVHVIDEAKGEVCFRGKVIEV